MQSEKVYKRLKAKNGLSVELRGLRWSDLDDVLFYINSLVEEGAEISTNTKKSRESEARWLGGKLASIENKEQVFIVASVEGRHVGQVTVWPQKGYSSHVGTLGIGLRKGYRDLGIGSMMMEEALIQSKELGLEIVELEVRETNGRARSVYERLGFEMVGRRPRVSKKDGEYVDHIMMSKTL